MNTLYMDLETSSGDPQLDSLNPWKNCSIAGVAFAVDNGEIHYLSCGHSIGKNTHTQDEAKAIVIKLLQDADVWVNHNVKYDAQVLFTNWEICADDYCRLIDTVCGAKLIDSDRFGHGLKQLAKDWLHADDWDKEIKKYTHNPSGRQWVNKDYGAIPANIAAKYAKLDVFWNRLLYKYIEDRLPSDCRRIYEIEIDVTPCLLQIERNGMMSYEPLIRRKKSDTCNSLCKLMDELKIRMQRMFRPDHRDDCFEIIHKQLGLPVVKWTDKNQPSFDKHAMAIYLSMNNLSDMQRQVIDRIADYRKLSTLNNLFLDPYLDYNILHVLHPSYNQLVRTGRMSCTMPNLQQLSADAKGIILPNKNIFGYAADDCDYLVTCDMSQVEFRLICHYTKDARALKLYAENPNTDFHQMVADWCEIDRKPAKNINFASAYGAGKKKITDMLTGADSDKSGLEIYTRYHMEFPQLKRISKQAEALCKQRGYVKTLLGRRRNLPYKNSYRAFNTVIQGSAADIMRAQLVDVSKVLKEQFNNEVKVVGIVHDELVVNSPADCRNEVTATLKQTMEDTANNLGCRVPFIADTGDSNKKWSNCK